MSLPLSGLYKANSVGQIGLVTVAAAATPGNAKSSASANATGRLRRGPCCMDFPPLFSRSQQRTCIYLVHAVVRLGRRVANGPTHTALNGQACETSLQEHPFAPRG